MQSNCVPTAFYEKNEQKRAVSAYMNNLRAQQNLINKTTNALIQATENPALPIVPLLPEMSANRDLRTTTERYNDTHALQTEIFHTLTNYGIDGRIVMEVIRQATSQQLQFIGNNIQPIIEYIEKHYRLGVPTVQAFENVMKRVEKMITSSYDHEPTATEAIEPMQEPTEAEPILSKEQWAKLSLVKQKAWLKEHADFFHGNDIFEELSHKNFVGLNKSTKSMTTELYEKWLDAKPGEIHGHGIRGRGLTGIKATEKLIPFGRYRIHHRKLDNNRLVIKTPSGGHIQQIPTQLISTKLKKVYKCIVGNGIPDGEEIGNLSDEERNHLAKVLKLCHLNDKIPVYGKLSNDEQQAREFEILRGEVVAGNNSPELKKKLKRLLLQFVKDGKLSRSEAYEVIIEIDD